MAPSLSLAFVYIYLWRTAHSNNFTLDTARPYEKYTWPTSLSNLMKRKASQRKTGERRNTLSG